MKQTSIVFKLSVAIISLSLITIIPLGFTINKIFSTFYYNELENQLTELTANYSKVITTLDNPTILTMYETLAHMMNQEVFIVNQDGIVVVNSGFPEVMEGIRINGTNLNDLKRGYTLKKEYHDQSTGEKYLSIGKPIIHHDQFIGAIFIAASISGIYMSIEKVENMILLASIGSILMAIGFAMFLSRRLSMPLLRMEGITRKIAKGDLDSRVSLSSQDELGSLGNAINDLAIELKRYRDNRKEFFANISHELRTPLTYIDGFTKALRQKLYQSEEEKEHMLSLVEVEAKRMTKLVDDLFELAKMEEENLSLEFQKVNLNEVVKSAVSKTELKAEEKGLSIRTNLFDQIPFLLGDQHRLEQVCLNLLENAIRYTEKGEITVATWKNQYNVYVSVADTGSGIPKENIPHLFERFYRVDKSRTRKLGGTGLGLAIVKQLVDLHNGTIKVSSEQGKGTTFQLVFPLNKEGTKK